jgi:hypothetical protein
MSNKVEEQSNNLPALQKARGISTESKQIEEELTRPWCPAREQNAFVVHGVKGARKIPTNLICYGPDFYFAMNGIPPRH